MKVRRKNGKEVTTQSATVWQPDLWSLRDDSAYDLSWMDRPEPESRIMLNTVELLTMRAIQRGELRRRKDAPPVKDVPLFCGLIERGLLVDRSGKLLLTEDGVAAIECAEVSRK
jgi:hypothetical protein